MAKRFQDFYDHIIRADEDLGAQIRYVADNPVRRGLVKSWQEYPFTGALGIDLATVMAQHRKRLAHRARRFQFASFGFRQQQLVAHFPISSAIAHAFFA